MDGRPHNQDREYRREPSETRMGILEQEFSGTVLRTEGKVGWGIVQYSVR